MSHPASNAPDPADLFASFLESHHDSGTHIDSLCTRHPQHADAFRRWWNALLAAGEVQEPIDTSAGRTFGPYHIERELGRGSQATVYLATDTRLGRRVALKVLPRWRVSWAIGGSGLERLLREAEAASRLDHPALCTVYETGEHEGQPFLAMRYVEGRTLAEYLAERHGQARAPDAADVRFALDYFEQTARALQVAHDAGLVHRDIKPGNLMLTDGEPPQPVLLDFGLARDADAQGLTRTGEIIGTPAYMAPEQVDGHSLATIDARADVWGLGATLYECPTLRRPFQAATQEGLFQRILDGSAPRAAGFNAAVRGDLEVVLATALARNPAERYASAEALADDLRAVRLGRPIRARPTPVVIRLGKWARRHPLAAASLLLALLSLTTGLAISLLSLRQAHRAQVAYRQLADAARLSALQQTAAELYPAWPQHAAAMEHWLRQARPLRERLPALRSRLAALRQDALPVSAADAETERRAHPLTHRIEELEFEMSEVDRWLQDGKLAHFRDVLELHRQRHLQAIANARQQLAQYRRYTFADPDQQLLHDELAILVADLDAFCRADGTLASVEERLRWARTVTERSISSAREAWQEAREHIAKSDAYAASRAQGPLPDMLGLLPLGADPDSDLLEFAHLRSGTAPSRHPGTGALQLEAGSGIVFVLIPAGTFFFGSQRQSRAQPNYFSRAEDQEGPPRRFDLPWFLIGKHEVTIGQWQRLGGVAENESLRLELLTSDQPTMPITQIGWHQADAVLRRHGLLLPSEVWWERAARADTDTAWPTGRSQVSTLGRANLRDASYVRVFGARGGERLPDDAWPALSPVWAFPANGFGLHGICGNASEWTADSYIHTGPTDFTFDEFGVRRVPLRYQRTIRGGSFSTGPREARSAARRPRQAAMGALDLGLRAARPVR